MSNRITQGKTSEASSFSLIKNEKNPLFHPFNFLANEYNNDLELLLKRLTIILGLGLFADFTKNKKIGKVIKVIQRLITVVVVTAEFVAHIKNYVKNTKENKTNPYQKRMNKICRLLKIKEKDPLYEDVPHLPFIKSQDIINWILESPKTLNIRIIKYVDMQTMEELKEFPDLSTSKMLDIAIHFELKGKEYIWDLIFQISILGTISVHNSTILGRDIKPTSDDAIFKAILFDYAQKFDFKSNTVKFKNSEFSSTLIASPRRSINIAINQFDTQNLLEEIEWILDNGGRRSYVFVGKQGTGKSSILRHIEQKVTKYPVFHLSPEDFQDASKIKDRFSIVKMFQPALLIVEDLDSCDLKIKNRVVGAYLDCIDDVNKDLRMVILSAVNDTSRVHHTIINRPGRSDRVIEIFPPRNGAEALEVIRSKYTVSKETYCSAIKIDADFNNPLLNKIADKCVLEKFTQAEISNVVVEQALIEIGMSKSKTINCKEFSEYLDRALSTQLETRKAIKNCNFRDEDPTDFTSPVEDTLCLDKACDAQYGQPYGSFLDLDNQLNKAGFLG